MHVDISIASGNQVCSTRPKENVVELGYTSTEATPFSTRQELSNPMSQTQASQANDSTTNTHSKELTLRERASSMIYQHGQNFKQRAVRKKKKNGNWKDEDLRATIAVVDESMNIKRAAMRFGIPRSSLEDWLYKRTRSRRKEKKGTLSADKECLIEDWICKCQEMGWPLTNLDLRLKVCKIIHTRAIPFKNGIPDAG
jgi:hypothetical protein